MTPAMTGYDPGHDGGFLSSAGRHLAPVVGSLNHSGTGGSERYRCSVTLAGRVSIARLRRGRWRRCSGVAVEGSPAPFVAHGRAGVGVAGDLLDVSKRNPSVKCRGYEIVAEAVRTDSLRDPGPAGQPLDRPVSGVAVRPSALGPDEERPAGPLADVQVDRSGRTGCQGG